MSFLLDIIVAVIFLIFISDSVKKGFIKSLFGIGVTVAAIIIATNFYTPVAKYLRSTVVYEQLTDNLYDKIEEYVSDTMNEQSMTELFEDAPMGIAMLLEGFGTSTDAVSEEYKRIIEAGEENVTAALSDYIVKPAARTLSDALAILVLFIAAVIVLNLLILVLDLIFKLPVLNFANKLLGFVVGAVLALLFSFVFDVVVNVALPYLPGAGLEIDADTVSKTMLFSKISEINPLSFIYK